MLMSLRSSIQVVMFSLMHKLYSEVSALRGRVTHIESKMGDVATTVNDLVDAHDDKIEGCR